MELASKWDYKAILPTFHPAQSPAVASKAFHCCTSVSPSAALLGSPCFWKCPLSSSSSRTVSPTSPEVSRPVSDPVPPPHSSPQQERATPFRQSPAYYLPIVCTYRSAPPTSVSIYLPRSILNWLKVGTTPFFTLHDRNANVFKSMTEWVGERVGGWINNSLPKNERDGSDVIALVL